MDSKGLERTNPVVLLSQLCANQMRRSLYVKPVGSGGWEAISVIAARRFDSRDRALDWARDVARREHQGTGQPWGVKVWAPQGGWVYDSTFGPACDDAAG